MSPSVIHGYQLTQEFTTAGGGHSRWTFARKGSREWFLKEFLAPTYPEEGAPGSDVTRARKRRRCLAFEYHQERVRQALAPLSALGGNLVVTIDFFRSGARYYKVTEKVDAVPVAPAELLGLLPGDRLVLLLTVTHSLRVLHQAGLVHGDLKPGNILVKQMGRHRYTTKLIDFDDCFFTGSPPDADEVIGDAAYYSPELMGYVLGEEPGERIGPASDVFALGLVFSGYLTGELPHLRDHQYAAEAARACLHLKPSRLGDRELEQLIAEMLAPDPALRPSCDQVFAALKRIQRHHGGPHVAGTRSELEGPSPNDLQLRGQRLNGALAPVAPAPGERPWLQGSLLKKKPSS
jgi:eukaryotic-like serine/threonine-protein kinase